MNFKRLIPRVYSQLAAKTRPRCHLLLLQADCLHLACLMQFFRLRNSGLMLFYWAFYQRSRGPICFCKALSFLYAALFRFHRWRGGLGLHLFKMRLKVCSLFFHLRERAFPHLGNVHIECCLLLLELADLLPDRWFLIHNGDHNL